MQYAKRNIVELDRTGGHYTRHVAAMTEEGLHYKSDIAAELGWRDALIATLSENLNEAGEQLRQAKEDGVIMATTGEVNDKIFRVEEQLRRAEAERDEARKAYAQEANEYNDLACVRDDLRAKCAALADAGELTLRQVRFDMTRESERRAYEAMTAAVADARAAIGGRKR